VLAPPDHPLEPERARNVEFSVGRQWGRFSVDVAAYQATYSNLVTLAPNLVLSDPDVKKFRDTLAERLKQQANLQNVPDLFTAFVRYSLAITSILPSAVAGLQPDVLRKIFDDPLIVHKFQNAEALRVRGIQANGSVTYGNTDLFGNYSYTNPILTQTTSLLSSNVESGRVGDIASHHINAGVQQRWRKLDTSLRLNYVSTRPMVLSNPVRELPGYAVVNGGVSFVDILPGFTAQVLINNIFNAAYADPGIRTADNSRFASSIPQPGRSIFVKFLARQLF